jgi:hypothetical protein
VALPTVPFKGIKRKLEGTPYLYQIGVSDTSVAVDIAPIYRAFPDLPLSGDRRAGILVYDGNLIIGSYLTMGNLARDFRRIIIRDKYRKKGLATRMVEQWFREIPGATDIPRQPINIMAVKTFLKAHANTVNWAVANGKDVPQKVRDAVASGQEAQEILAGLPAVENAPPRRNASFGGRRLRRLAV